MLMGILYNVYNVFLLIQEIDTNLKSLSLFGHQGKMYNFKSCEIVKSYQYCSFLVNSSYLPTVVNTDIHLSRETRKSAPTLPNVSTAAALKRHGLTSFLPPSSFSLASAAD